MRRFFSLSVATILLSPVTLGGQVTPATPDQVVREFFRAEEEERWLDAAHLLDLKRFESMRRAIVTGWRETPPGFPRTPQELMKWDPDMPLAVAEYQVKKMKESMQDSDFLSYQFARVPSVDSLAALTADQAAARWLEARGRKWEDELSRKLSSRHQPIDCPPLPDSVVAKMKANAKQPVATVLGVTEKSDSVRYVVVGSSVPLAPGEKKREPPDPPEEMSPSVITLRKGKDGWKIIPSYGLPNSQGFTSFTVFGTVCQSEPPAPSSGDKR